MDKSCIDSIDSFINYHFVTYGLNKSCTVHQNTLYIYVHINLTYLASACKKMGMLSAFAEEPMTQTTSPYSCIMCSISRVTEVVQSVNSDTNSGTLSICSRCGRILSIPRGNFA